MILYVLFILIYFIPSIVVYGKKHDSQVIVLNIFTGWTGIGWLISLIWGLKK